MLIELALLWIIALIGCALIGSVKGWLLRGIVLGLVLGPLGVLICLRLQSRQPAQLS